ncbi:MAG: cupin domain-containing protein [Clostridiaceae bacterium]|nr:cupin domain-containing protein [Clostridiaceae bacterium]
MNWRLAGKGILCAKNMEIIIGEQSKGGESKFHQHSESEQAIFIIEGRAKVEVGDEVKEVGPNSLIYIPVNTKHRTVLLSDRLRCLVMYSPELKDW